MTLLQRIKNSRIESVTRIPQNVLFHGHDCTADIPFSQVSPLSTATDLSTPHFSLKTTTRPSEVLLKTLSGAILSQELKIISGYASHARSRRDDEGKKNHGTPQVSVYITNLIRARTSGKAQTNQWTFLCKESRLFSAAPSEV